jgi:transcriptional regulator with XRE-family HTH domain
MDNSHDRVREIFSSNIRCYRDAFGCSQEQMAEVAGFSTSFIAAIELQNKFPSSISIGKLAAAFGLQPYELFRDPEQREEDPTARLGRLKENLKAGVSDYIESSFRRYLEE